MMILATIEIFLNHLGHDFGFLFDFLTDFLIFERLKLFDDIVNHFAVEDAVFFEDCAVSAQFVSRFPAGSGKLSEAFHQLFVFWTVDVNVNVSLFSEVQSAFHFEAVACSANQTCEQQVDVSGAIRAAEFDSLLLGTVFLHSLL